MRNHRSIPFFCVFRGGVRVVRVEKIPAGCSNCPAGVPPAQPELSVGQVFLLASLAMVPPAQTVTRNHRSIPFFCVFRGGVRVVRVEKTPARCSNCPAGVPPAQTVMRKRRHKRQIAQTFVRKIPKIVPE